MNEKLRINPLLLRIRTSIASLRSTNYNLLPLSTLSPSSISPLPPTTFRHGRGSRTILFLPHFVRRKWGYISFILLVLFIVIIRLQLVKRHIPFEETPAVTGHTKQSHQQQTSPPTFSTFIDNYPKQLAILIIPSSTTSIDTFSKSIIDTWGKIAKQNKSLSVDLWFATSEDTLRKFGWPNIPYDDGKTNNKSGREVDDDDDVIEGVRMSGNEKETEIELKNLLREMMQETMQFEGPTELSDEQKEFQQLTKALHYLYENHLDHYNYVLKITDKSFVRLPKLLEFLSILNHTENIFPIIKQPKLIGRPNLNNETTKTFCSKGSGYIINKYLLTIIGPHLPFCLSTINKIGLKENNDLREDLSIERCFTRYVPMFKGCETFVDNGLGKLPGHEFLYLNPNDVINWEKYKEPLEVFNDEHMNRWRFADAIVIGEVNDPLNMMALEEWYGKGGKFDEMVEKMGGVIPDPEPILTQEVDRVEDNDERKDVNKGVQNQGSEEQLENLDDLEEILTTMTAEQTETLSNENVNYETKSEQSSKESHPIHNNESLTTSIESFDGGANELNEINHNVDNGPDVGNGEALPLSDEDLTEP
ncbi:5191_t:CDS:2 [Funneliformis geosporum]|uniref:5191_t:CDS:1 n=1 Tax=Funneliformis geosporum TaxID=1117311 RepID=A0A9W4WRP9_9GLOM|nr:5191_t:CDS:2 [Funneliformis geosporum]